MFGALILATCLVNSSRSVTFSYSNPSAHNVKINGDFNTWNDPEPMEQSGSVWTKKILLPDDGRCEYKFVVDGNWIDDPVNPVKTDNGLGGENSVWQGPRYRFFATEEHTPQHPLERTTVEIGSRQIVIFKPVRSAGLPILIYGDGPSYEHFGKIQNVIENMVEEGKIRPVIIVLVPPIDRMTEYGSGWRAYAFYLFDKVLPAIRASTGASDKAGDLYMGGSSMGGLIAFRLAEEFPAKFSGGIQGQSTAFQWSPAIQGQEFTDLSTVESLRKIAPQTRIWVDWGELEGGLVVADQKAVANLQSMHRAYGSKVTAEGHNWTAWRNRMTAGLILILGPAGPPSR
jgi:enterochelin esterase-like enzyme